MTQITDYAEFNQPPFLIEYLRQDSDPLKLIQMQDQQFNELEQVFQDLFLKVHIATAEGEQLNNLGRILQVDRSGRNDPSYRTVLTGKAAANTKSGTPEVLLEVIREIYQATEAHYVSNFPAGFKIQQNGAYQLFLYGELMTDTGDNLFLSTGDQLYYSEADTISEQIILDLAPAGVEILVESI